MNHVCHAALNPKSISRQPLLLFWNLPNLCSSLLCSSIFFFQKLTSFSKSPVNNTLILYIWRMGTVLPFCSTINQKWIFGLTWKSSVWEETGRTHGWRSLCKWVLTIWQTVTTKWTSNSYDSHLKLSCGSSKCWSSWLLHWIMLSLLNLSNLVDRYVLIGFLLQVLYFRPLYIIHFFFRVYNKCILKDEGCKGCYIEGWWPDLGRKKKVWQLWLLWGTIWGRQLF